MSDEPPAIETEYRRLLGKISEIYVAGQARAAQAVNTQVTETYWQIGRDIVEFEQQGSVRAAYGKGLLDRLSRDLSLRHGKGFSRSNVIRIRQFYLVFPKGATLSHQLSWSHIVELLKVEDPLERGFYEQQSIREGWTVRELKRQRESSLFLRLAAGKDKNAILQLATEGHPPPRGVQCPHPSYPQPPPPAHRRQSRPFGRHQSGGARVRVTGWLTRATI